MAFILFADKLHKFDKKDARTSLYDQLMTLKQIYGKIWDVSNLINDCFGWSLLAIVMFQRFKSMLINHFLRLRSRNILSSSPATDIGFS